MTTWHDPALSPAERASALLADMTLEEKVGQLGSFWPRPAQSSVIEGDVAPMESALNSGATGFDAISAHGLGHITRNYGTEPVSVEQGLDNLERMQRSVIERSAHQVPAIAHEECLTGFTAFGATVYPAAIAWGATWDPELIEDMAYAIGSDMRAVGVHQGLSPLMDVVRDYRWGRVEETIGEDPYLVGTLGTAYVKGLQRAGTHATLKHFAGYSASRAGRNHAPVPMGRREFEDVILPPFEMAVRDGRAASVMNSYSDIDGEPAAASVELLTTTLRERWGFTGTVVSDYWAITFLDLMHHVAADLADAGRIALTAGIDVELPGTGAYQHLVELVRDGRLDAEFVDRAALRVLTQKAELGLLDDGWNPRQGEIIDLDSQHHRALARRIAEQSVVLLANDGVLPLAGVSRVAVLGPCAAEPRTFMGCYSFPNHVLGRYPEAGLGIEMASLLEGLTTELDGVEVAYAPGVPILDRDASGIADAVARAKAAEVAVVAVGDLAGLFGKGTSGEGCDAVDLRLPGLQHDLVEAVLDAGTPVVLVVVSGRPYALGGLAERCAAVVQAFMPGEEGASALAGVLSGRVNPSGKLPVGIPRGPGGQPGTYLVPPLGWYSEGVSNLDPRPLYPFGFGSSYTTFTVEDVSLSATEVATDGAFSVEAMVTNTGTRAGAEVVQLYARDVIAQVTRPVKELLGYTKVALEPGERRRVRFDVHTDRLSFTGVDYTRVVEPGVVEISVGTSSEDLHTVTLTLIGALRPVHEGRVLGTPVTVAEA